MGQKFGYVSDDSTTTSDGRDTIHFEADGEVLALLPSGNPQKLAYTVKVLRVTNANIPPTSLPTIGAKVVVEYAAHGKKIVIFNDNPADPDAADFLDSVLWITTRNHTDQEIYGPTVPVAVGASWPVNPVGLDDNEEGRPSFYQRRGFADLAKCRGCR